jgi:hypothetical protein
LCVLFGFFDHGPWRPPGDTNQALARWRHPLASSEAVDMIHWSTRSVSYRYIAMAIDIAIDSPAFFVAVDLLSPTTIAK